MQLPDFSCVTFPAGVSEADLIRRFTVANVKAMPVVGGGAEGDSTMGTVLFPQTLDAKVEILWRDRRARAVPAVVRIVGERTRWKSGDGITLGSDLRTVERANGGPFLLGSIENPGAVRSWSEGRLAAGEAAGCRVGLTFEMNPPAKPDVRLPGSPPFRSSLQALQTLNPTVSKMFLTYVVRPAG